MEAAKHQLKKYEMKYKPQAYDAFISQNAESQKRTRRKPFFKDEFNDLDFSSTLGHKGPDQKSFFLKLGKANSQIGLSALKNRGRGNPEFSTFGYLGNWTSTLHLQVGLPSRKQPGFNGHHKLAHLKSPYALSSGPGSVYFEEEHSFEAYLRARVGAVSTQPREGYYDGKGELSVSTRLATSPQ